MFKDIEEQLAVKRGRSYKGKYVKGLPFGLVLPSGVVGGEQ